MKEQPQRQVKFIEVTQPQDGQPRPGIQYYDVRGMAKALSMSQRWIRQQIKDGALQSVRLGKKHVVAADTLQKFMSDRSTSLNVQPA